MPPPPRLSPRRQPNVTVVSCCAVLTDYPRAIQIARTFQDLNSTDSFIYTTHPWLVSTFLDCPPNFVLNGIRIVCPSADELAVFTQAVRDGIITWHRGPFNLQPENMDASLFAYGLSVAAQLDDRFGFDRKRTLSQRDVPGMTRGVIPLLTAANVTAISVGVNGGTCPPFVPHAFVWQEPLSGAEVLALWHSGGYPNNPGVTPALAGGIARSECVVVRGFRQALCWVFRTDNSGPPADIDEVLNNYDVLAAQFPDATTIRASTFDDFTQALYPHRHELLTTVSKEIGDVWVQGVAADPLKYVSICTTPPREGCLSSARRLVS
jgi:hypothetical protein